MMADQTYINAAAEKLIKDFEGLRLKAYKCPAGVWTIGWGHTGPDVHRGLEITETRADELFRQDVAGKCQIVRDAVQTPLTDNQFSAVVSFVFNNGAAAFRSSTLRKKLNAADYAGAADEFLKWVYCANPKTGVKERNAGLIRRRAAERELFLRG